MTVEQLRDYLDKLMASHAIQPDAKVWMYSNGERGIDLLEGATVRGGIVQGDKYLVLI